MAENRTQQATGEGSARAGFVPHEPLGWAASTSPGLLDDDESQRIAALHRYGVLDTGPEPAFDALTELAAWGCETPCALITLVDHERLWFKARVGLTVDTAPRQHAPCAATIEQPTATPPLELDPTRDPRFAPHPVLGAAGGWQFYAGVPLFTPQGWAIGSLCVLDRRPRVLTSRQRQTLTRLAEQVEAQLELRRARALLELQCNSDEVTGLWNRHAFDRRLGEEWLRWSRHGGNLAMLAIDVDHFKHFNDRHGHRDGDVALQQVALGLEGALRAHDVLAHFGGGEFAVLLPATDLSGAMAAAERMRAAMRALPWAIEPLTVSIGVAVTAREHDVESAALAARAHRALTRAKSLGRDCVEPCLD